MLADRADCSTASLNLQPHNGLLCLADRVLTRLPPPRCRHPLRKNQSCRGVRTIWPLAERETQMIMQRILAKVRAANTPGLAKKYNRRWLIVPLAFLVMGAVQHAHAQTYTVLHRFSVTDGAFPVGNVILDSSGNLYSTTDSGGIGLRGTVFELEEPSGKESVLYNFADGSDGGFPIAGLVRDASGNLYGTTEEGGTFNSTNCSGGCGTVFEVDTHGNETVLYTFTGGADGAFPIAGLVMDASGNLYGTTNGGGTLNTTNCSTYGCGVVFEVNPSHPGSETVLYTFTGGADGGFPEGGHLIFDSSGNLYGTTPYGGTTNAFCGTLGCGVVFKMDTSGNETVLYSFTGVPTGTTGDGASPFSGLFMDKSGNLYGTTIAGGTTNTTNCFGGCGTVFQLNTHSHHETALYSFTGNSTPGTNGDGEEPYGTVVMDASGNLYGTTAYGGYLPSSGECSALGCGIVFKVDPSSRKETVLHTFTGTQGTTTGDGEVPQADLTIDASGNLYGTTLDGGSSSTSCNNPPFYGGCGTVFKLSIKKVH